MSGRNLWTALAEVRGCPCDGCGQYRRCAEEKLACPRFSSWARKETARRIRAAGTCPTRKGYRALFPGDLEATA